jgi:hypothetical protein
MRLDCTIQEQLVAFWLINRFDAAKIAPPVFGTIPVDQVSHHYGNVKLTNWCIVAQIEVN